MHDRAICGREYMTSGVAWHVQMNRVAHAVKERNKGIDLPRKRMCHAEAGGSETNRMMEIAVCKILPYIASLYQRACGAVQ